MVPKGTMVKIASTAAPDALRAQSSEGLPHTPIQFTVKMVPLLQAMDQKGLTFEEVIASRLMPEDEVRKLVARGPDFQDVLTQFSLWLDSVSNAHRRVVLEKDLEIHRLRMLVQKSKRDSDPLTGLPSESFFRRKLVRHINDRRIQTFALVYLDVHRFKEINDLLMSHDEGDKVLKQVATILQNHLRPDDIASRFHGDEFALLLPHVEDREQAVKIIERIMKDLVTYVWDLDFEALRKLRPMLDPGVLFFNVPMDHRRQIQPMRTRKFARGMVKIADRMMYEAKGLHKKTGRPHICSGEVQFLGGRVTLKGGMNICEVAA